AKVSHLIGYPLSQARFGYILPAHGTSYYRTFVQYIYGAVVDLAHPVYLFTQHPGNVFLPVFVQLAQGNKVFIAQVFVVIEYYTLYRLAYTTHFYAFCRRELFP